MYCTENALVLLYFLVHCYLELYYLVFWEEENSVTVVAASNIANGRQTAVEECCDVVYDLNSYVGRIAAKGMNWFMPV